MLLLAPNLPAQDQYVIGPYLNQGGMATVFLGKHIDALITPIVPGRLRSELTHRSRLRALLFSEAELQSRLLHPCIVRTTDLAVIDGEYHLVMEYVRGGDLLLLLRRAGCRGQRFSAAAALFIVRELLQAPGYAISSFEMRAVFRWASFIATFPGQHPDFRRREVKLSGLRNRADFCKWKSWVCDCAAGGYMSPEQARQEELDQRSDLFSLGTVLTSCRRPRSVCRSSRRERKPCLCRPILPPSARCVRACLLLRDAVILRALQLDKKSIDLTSALKRYEELLLLSQRHGLWMIAASWAHIFASCSVMIQSPGDLWKSALEPRIPSFLEADELWEEPSGSVLSESMMAISVARTLSLLLRVARTSRPPAL